MSLPTRSQLDELLAFLPALEIWDAQSGLLLKRFNLETGIENFIGDFALAFSPNGKFLVARSGFGNNFFFDTAVTLFGVPVP